MRQHAHEEAARLYGLALGLTTDATRRCELLLALGEAQWHSGDIPRSEEAFQQAAALARALRAGPENPEAALLLADAALGRQVLTIVVMTDEPRVRLIDEALGAVSEADSPVRARLLARLAGALHYQGSPRRRDALIAAAVAMARRIADAALLRDTLALQFTMMWRPEQLAGAAAAAAEFRRLAAQIGRDQDLLEVYRFELIARLNAGDVHGVDAAQDAHERLADSLRLPVRRWRSVMWRAMRALLEGRFADVERRLAEAMALAQQVRHPDSALWFLAQTFTLRREQGRLAEMEAPLRGSVERFPAFERIAADPAVAPEGSGADDIGLERLLSQGEGMLCMTYLAEACVALGDRERAAPLYALLLPYAGHAVIVGPAIVWYGPVAHRLGLLAATLGDWSAAAVHFEDALGRCRAVGARPWQARVAIDYAAMLVARRQRSGRRPTRESAELSRQARGLLDAALAEAEALGMPALAGRARALQAELTAMAAPPSTAAPYPAGLTAREVESLRLVAAGRSNREIAQALFLSVATVQNHLARIFSRIDVRSRAEAAAYANRHGLAAPPESP